MTEDGGGERELHCAASDVSDSEYRFLVVWGRRVFTITLLKGMH